MRKRTYVDANVLITAFRGQDLLANLCLEVLDDPDRDLVVSDYLSLEVLPKPMFHQRAEEIQFMRAVLSQAENIAASPEITKRAFNLASTYNLSTLDALHAAAALFGSADELVTIEKPTKPLCQIREIDVISLYL